MCIAALARGRRLELRANLRSADSERGRREETTVEREVSAEVGERRRQLGGAAVGVEQKTARGKFRGAQRVEQRTEGVEAVNRDREIARGGEVELPAENFELLVEGCAAEPGESWIVGPRAVEDPTVEADLADGDGSMMGRMGRRERMRFEVGEKFLLPVGRAIADVPRVEAVTRKKEEWIPRFAQDSARSARFG